MMCFLFTDENKSEELFVLFFQVSNLKKILKSMLEYYHDVS